MLGLGVRGVGWREIEIVRLPTGQPTVTLHDRALRRAEQLGMERIAVSISHERDYAVAVAFGIRTRGGAFVFPVDVEARLDDRERQILARMERLRALHAEAQALEATAAGWGSGTTASGVGAARRTVRTRGRGRRAAVTGSAAPAGGAARTGSGPLDEASVAGLVPERPEAGHKGTFGTLMAVCGSLDFAGAALLAGAAALRTGAGLVVLAVPAALQPVVAGRVPGADHDGPAGDGPVRGGCARGRGGRGGAPTHRAAGRAGAAAGPATRTLVAALLAAPAARGAPGRTTRCRPSWTPRRSTASRRRPTGGPGSAGHAC